MAKKPTLQHTEMLLTRAKTRLKLAFGRVEKLEKQKKRLQRATIERPRGHALLSDIAGTMGAAIREAAEDAGMVDKPADNSAAVAEAPKQPEELGIPEFLRRSPAEDKAMAERMLTPVADRIAADQIREEQAALKKAKAKGRVAKMLAKKSGDLKKMPLSGKAALDAIKNG